MKIKLMLAMLACAAAVMAAPVLVQVETTNPRPWNNLRLNMDASYTWGNNTTQSYAGIDIRGNFRVTNEVGELESVDVIFDAPIDDAYYARFNGGWSNISWLLDLGDATNALNTRVGVLETSTNALNTRIGAVETATGALNTAVGNLNNSTNALNAKVVALNNSTNALNARVGTLEGSTNAMNTRLGSLDASTNAINAVANNALPKTFTNAGVMAAMQITGGSPEAGAIWVATNTVGQGGWKVTSKFRAYTTNYYSIAGSANTKINFETEEFDNNNTYNTASGKWIPGREGYVHIEAQLYSTNSTAGKHATIKIVRDGANLRWGRGSPGGAIHTWNISVIDYCPSATNEYEIFAESEAGITIGVRGASTYTYFWGYELP